MRDALVTTGSVSAAIAVLCWLHAAGVNALSAAGTPVHPRQAQLADLSARAACWAVLPAGVLIPQLWVF